LTAAREERLARLASETVDVLVIGAGIAGAASAAALTAAGAKVALVDRGDFGSGTSQESSNLVWGGLKYLENGEVGLVSRLCRSRDRLRAAFPTAVREVRFLAAVDRDAPRYKRSAAVLLAGGWAYWLLGRGATKRPRWWGGGALARRAPELASDRFRGALEYSDAVLVDHDARFVFSFVRDAAKYGAICVNYVEVGGARRVGSEWEVEATDRASSFAAASRTIRARVVVNAAGPWTAALNEAHGCPSRTRLRFSKGIHLIVERIAPEERVLAFFDERDRPFFVIPLGGRSCVGTTDTPVESPRVEVTDEDRRFLLDHVNARLSLERPLTMEDVIAERCGVRALAIEGDSGEDESWLELSRRHVIERDDAQARISVFGGKLTDCLNVGEEVVAAARALGLALTSPERWAGEPPAARRAEFDAAAAGCVDAGVARRLWRRYGEDAFAMLDAIEDDPGLAQPVVAGAELRQCELDHILREEMVVDVEDLLRRRTRLGLVLTGNELADVGELAELRQFVERITRRDGSL